MAKIQQLSQWLHRFLLSQPNLCSKSKRKLYIVLSLSILLANPACSGSGNSWGWWRQKSIQTHSFYSDTAKQIKAIGKKADTIYWSQPEEKVIRTAYLRALPKLKLTIHDEWHPNPEAIVQKLLEYPEEAIKILEGCDRYWRTSFDGYPIPANAEVRPWTVAALRSRLQNRSMEHVVIHPADDTTAIVMDQCGSGGAYNLVYANYLYKEKKDGITIEPINTPEYDIETKTIISNNTNINNDAYLMYYDPKTQTFDRFRKYRGLGDCGKVTKYRLQNNRMVIQEVREDDICNMFHDPIVKPEQFPRIYP